MATDFDNNMRGVLFKNERKTKANHPDYRGSCEIEGVKYWLSAWRKTPKSGGAAFLSIAFTEADEDKGEQKEPEKSSTPVVDDDVPF